MIFLQEEIKLALLYYPASICTVLGHCLYNHHNDAGLILIID